jgi:transposase
MERAFSAVKYGGLGIREAANKYKVPFSTLQWKLSTGKVGKLRRGSKPNLPPKIEELIVETVTQFNEMGFGLTRREVSKVAISPNYFLII